MNRLIAILLLLLPLAAQSATITAASASRADVGTAYASTADGDTLEIPAGVAGWSTGLTVEKAIHIKGAGTNHSGGTILKFDADISLFTISSAAKTNSVFKLSDFQMSPGTTASPTSWIVLNGCNTNNSYVVCSNLYFSTNTGLGLRVIGALGVIKNSTWYMPNNSIGCYIYHDNWDGEILSAGSFYQPVQYGTDKMWVVEDCAITRTTATYAFTDAYNGARYAVRYSELTNCWLEAHGTESLTRGTRAMESYMNTFYGDGASSYAHNFRSGTGIIFSNTVANVPSANNFAQLSAYRSVMQAVPYGGSNGRHPYDVNNATTFDTGTATAGGTRSLTDSGKSWTVNQWVGYTLTRTAPITSGYTTNTDFRHGYISANTATVITVERSIGGAFPDIVFTTGDSYEIRKVVSSLDMPGAGADNVYATHRLLDGISITSNEATATLSSHGFSTGDNIILEQLFTTAASDVSTIAQVTNLTSSTFKFPLYTPNGTHHPVLRGYVAKVSNAQTLDPCYEWGNTVNGGDADFAAAQTFIVENTHFYNDTAKPGYTPLAYPHPKLAFAAGSFSGAAQVAAQLSGSATLSGAVRLGP